MHYFCIYYSDSSQHESYIYPRCDDSPLKGKISRHLSVRILTAQPESMGSILGPLFFIMYVYDLMRLFDEDIVHITNVC